MPKWKQEQLDAALKAIESGKGKETIHKLAKKHGIPSSTLYDHARKKVSKSGAGRPTVLTWAEEEELVYCCQVLQEMGFGMTKENVTAIVTDYVSTKGRRNPFHGGVPGKDWWIGFLQRWPKLVERKPQHLSKQRASSANPATVGEYFKKVGKLMDDLGITHCEDLDRRVWNCDETGIATAVASKVILARRGSKWVHEVGGGSGRELITLMGCGSAAGERLSPMILYKGKHLYSTWTINGPPGALYSTSESGWMEKENFFHWFQKCFLPAIKDLLQTGPVVLFLDGHHSHLSTDFLELAKVSNVHPFCLPSHTSHFLQPLDVAVYGPLKSAWKAILKDYKVTTRASNLTKEAFPSMVAKLWEKTFQPLHLKAGFRACGLFPFNANAVLPYKMATALPFTESSEGMPVHSKPETPLRKELRHFFADHLKPKEKVPKAKRRRVDIHATGDALTNDDVLHLLKEAEAEKQAKRKQKSKKEVMEPIIDVSDDDKDVNHCFSCGVECIDGQEKLWVGCDECYRWYHYKCAGFSRRPKREEEIICKICSS